MLDKEFKSVLTNGGKRLWKKDYTTEWQGGEAGM